MEKTISTLRGLKASLWHIVDDGTCACKDLNASILRSTWVPGSRNAVNHTRTKPTKYFEAGGNHG